MRPFLRRALLGLLFLLAVPASHAATPDAPADRDCIDFLFFTARRHDNDPAAARQYLAWETGLLAQLDEQERGVFRIPDA